MNCKKCGKEIEGEYQYCYKCGDTFELALRQRITGEQLTELSPREKKIVNTIKRYPILGAMIAILVVSFLVFLFV